MQKIPFSILILMISMVSIQTGAAAAKQLFPVVGAVGATLLRLGLAALVLFAIRRPWREKLTWNEFLSIALYGSSLGCMNLLFYLALERIPLGIAVALEFTGPLTVALCYSRRAFDFFWAILASCGIALILPLSQASAMLDPWGVCLALGAGCCWALYILFGKKAGASVRGDNVAAWGMLVATLVVLPVAMVQSGGQLLDFKILPLGFGVAILASALPYSLEIIALKNLPAKTFGILMSLEPVLAAASGLMFLGEHLSFIQWLAIAGIITASIGSALSAKSEAIFSNNDKVLVKFYSD